MTWTDCCAPPRRDRQLPVEGLETLAEAVFDIRSLQDARVWLETRERPPQ